MMSNNPEDTDARLTPPYYPPSSSPEDSTMSGMNSSSFAGPAASTHEETRGFETPLARNETAAQEMSRRRPVLVVLSDRKITERLVFRQPEVTLGREIDCELTVSDGRISRHHARIVWENFEHDDEEPVCFIEDLGSRNGTIVNGQKVLRNALRDGDRILLGTILIAYYVKDEHELTLDQQLLEMATTDALTGLSNRLFFTTDARREMERARRYKRPLCLLMIDLDLFKVVNDTYGHSAGDMVLRKFARILAVSMREGDVTGRIGGEEFAVLLPETDLEGAQISGERLRQRVEDYVFRYREHEIRITVSVGIAQYGEVYATRQAYFDAADKALYEAKTGGRNRVCMAPLLEESAPPAS